jgi:hypothetical protein
MYCTFLDQIFRLDVFRQAGMHIGNPSFSTIRLFPDRKLVLTVKRQTVKLTDGGSPHCHVVFSPKSSGESDGGKITHSISLHVPYSSSEPGMPSLSINVRIRFTKTFHVSGGHPDD